MKIWGDVPGAGGPRAAVVISNEEPISVTSIEVLAVRQPDGIYLLIPPRQIGPADRLFGEGGTELERLAIKEMGFKIAWRGPAAKPKYVPTGKRGGGS